MAHSPDEVSVDTYKMNTVAAGIQSDVVAPLDQAMRAMSDAELQHYALGEVGLDALTTYYSPFHSRECEELQRGVRTAKDIADAVQNCSNTYLSAENNLTSYISQSIQTDRSPMIDSTLNRYKAAMDYEFTVDHPSAASLAATKGMSVYYGLIDTADTFVHVATVYDLKDPGRFSNIGQESWRRALLDDNALSVAMNAREYAQKATLKINENAPGILAALSVAWSGQARDAALSSIQTFNVAVEETTKRAAQTIATFDRIFTSYKAQCEIIRDTMYSSSALLFQQKMSQKAMEDFEIHLTSLIKETVETAIASIKDAIDTEIQKNSQIDVVRFPALRSLPDAPVR